MASAGATMHDQVLRGAAIIDAIKASGVEFVISVPDIVTSEGLLRPLAQDKQIRLIRVCKEDEGISICAALAVCGPRALLLIQNTGLFDSINALRAIGVEYRQPICMMVGLQGKEPDLLPTQSGKYSVRIVEPMLDVMGIEHHLLQGSGDIPKIRPAIDKAYATSFPVVMLVGRSPQ
jgi:sulfopyruvate decarboxylase subunit alpha